MKKLILTMASLAVLALLAYTPAVKAAYMGEETQQSATAPDMNTYTLGLSGPNFCKTETVTAPNVASAIDEAAKACVNCSIRDLTGDYTYGEAPWEAERTADVFCKEELK